MPGTKTSIIFADNPVTVPEALHDQAVIRVELMSKRGTRQHALTYHWLQLVNLTANDQAS